ncbi:serine protease [Solibacillus daqui]|uniref:serine protease n=1 Tax=Solibacillus daqui TaxID=2912187 RepID=UPI002366DDF5|nr:serine protease [Solibacillus daqui]
MNVLDSKDSLFFLTEEQQQYYSQWHHYEYYFSLLRHEFLHTPYVLLTMADFGIFYYYDDKKLPVVNSENAFVFLLRQFMLDTAMKNQKLHRMKAITVGNPVQSLIAAAATTNLFLDGLRDVLREIPKDDLVFFSKYSNNSMLLYDPRFLLKEGYPKRLVQLETTILKELRNWIQVNNDLFSEKVQQIIRMLDEISIIERELFSEFQL